MTDKETGTDKASEGDLNGKGQKDDRIKEDFATDEYRIMLVANKFQTGFDQPLLHTMYVDKELSGMLAVQTLSRLNRTCPGKEDAFVLDFLNKAEDILEAFRPYYRTAALSDVTDPNLVHRVKAKLDATAVYPQSEVDALAKIFSPRMALGQPFRRRRTTACTSSPTGITRVSSRIPSSMP